MERPVARRGRRTGRGSRSSRTGSRAGHHLPYTMALGGGAGRSRPPFRVRPSRSCGPSDGDRLLVLAADPGSYGLDWSARAVSGAEPVARPDPCIGRARRGGGCSSSTSPPARSPRSDRRDERVGGRLGRRRRRRRPRLGGSEHRIGLVPLHRRPPRPRGAHRAHPLPSRRGSSRGSRSRRTAARGDRRGLLERPRAAERQRHDRRPRHGRRPIPGRASRPSASSSGCDDESLWYARYDGTGTACGRISLDGPVDELWRGDAFIGDEMTKPTCSIATAARSCGRRTRRTACRPSSLGSITTTRELVAAHLVQRRVIADSVFPDVRTMRWTAADGLEIDGLLMTPRGARARCRC